MAQHFQDNLRPRSRISTSKFNAAMGWLQTVVNKTSIDGATFSRRGLVVAAQRTRRWAGTSSKTFRSKMVVGWSNFTSVEGVVSPNALARVADFDDAGNAIANTEADVWVRSYDDTAQQQFLADLSKCAPLLAAGVVVPMTRERIKVWFDDAWHVFNGALLADVHVTRKCVE